MSTDPDIVALYREYAWEAIDGAIVQMHAAGRFLARGEDRYATAAFQRGIDFIKLAAPEMRALGSQPPQVQPQRQTEDAP